MGESVLDSLAAKITGIVSPVTICMALTVWLVRTLDPGGASSSSAVAIANIYYHEEDSDSAGIKIQGAVINATIFVVFVGLMTFALVLLFKYGYSNIIWGYMGFAGFSIFFVLGGTLTVQLIQLYRIPVDIVSFLLLLYNVSVVGVLCLFFMPAPLLMKQGYLIITSVVTAYVFSHTPAWTTWTLLVAMALYDLYAVLTPGGPLKLDPAAEGTIGSSEDAVSQPTFACFSAGLISLSHILSKMLLDIAHERDEDIPALIYEARGASRAQRQQLRRGERLGGSGDELASLQPSLAALPGPIPIPVPMPAASGSSGRPGAEGEAAGGSHGSAATGAEQHPSEPRGDPSQSQGSLAPGQRERREDSPRRGHHSPGRPGESGAAGHSAEGHPEAEAARAPEGGGALQDDGGESEPLVRPGQAASSQEAVPEAAQHGDQQQASDRPGSYAEDRFDTESGLPEGIKLGLGDFIFYSMLVGRASMHDLLTAAAAYLAIIAGLGGTLLLLAIRRQALPALPFSIALGIVFYFMSRYALEPYVLRLTTSLVLY